MRPVTRLVKTQIRSLKKGSFWRSRIKIDSDNAGIIPGTFLDSSMPTAHMPVISSPDLTDQPVAGNPPEYGSTPLDFGKFQKITANPWRRAKIGHPELPAAGWKER